MQPQHEPGFSEQKTPPKGRKSAYIDPAAFVDVSETIWHDSNGLTSRIIKKKLQITSNVEVDKLEYLSELPSMYPIPRDRTAYLVDLRDPKFMIYDTKGKLYTPDALMKDKVHHSVVRCLPFLTLVSIAGSGLRERRYWKG